MQGHVFTFTFTFTFVSPFSDDGDRPNDVVYLRWGWGRLGGYLGGTWARVTTHTVRVLIYHMCIVTGNCSVGLTSMWLGRALWM